MSTQDSFFGSSNSENPAASEATQDLSHQGSVEDPATQLNFPLPRLTDPIDASVTEKPKPNDEGSGTFLDPGTTVASRTKDVISDLFNPQLFPDYERTEGDPRAILNDPNLSMEEAVTRHLEEVAGVTTVTPGRAHMLHWKTDDPVRTDQDGKII